jgi:hypothetical protein
MTDRHAELVPAAVIASRGASACSAAMERSSISSR